MHPQADEGKDSPLNDKNAIYLRKSGKFQIKPDIHQQCRTTKSALCQPVSLEIDFPEAGRVAK